MRQGAVAPDAIMAAMGAAIQRGIEKTPALRAHRSDTFRRRMDDPARTRSVAGACLAALLAATAATFAVSLRNGFVWDDVQLIARNDAPLSLQTLRDAFGRHFWDTAGFSLADRGHFYRPVVTLAYALTRALLGGGPFGFHLVNVAAHLAVVALAFAHARRRIDPSERSPEAPVAAALGVAAFALHPARAESVAWAAGAPDLWASLFTLAALRLDPARRPAPAALAFALALLSKEAVAFVPAALLVDALWLRPPHARGPALRGAAVLGAVLVAVLALRAAVLPRTAASVGPPLVAVPRVLAALGYLLARTVDPWPLTVWSSRVAHDASGAARYPIAYVLAGLAFVAGVAALGLYALRRAPAARPFAADLAWFALALLPVASPVDLSLPQLIADRYLYLPHAALAALVGRALAPRLQGPARASTLAACGALLAALGVGAFAHARHFHDEEGLWRHEVAVDPANPIARLSLAGAIASRRRYGEALSEVRSALVSAHAQNARAVQMSAVLLAAAILVDGLPDADQRGLRSVEGFLDALGNHPGQPATLDAGGLRMQLVLDPGDAARVRAMPVDWALPLADAALRTLSPEVALARFAALRRALPDNPRVYAGTAVAWALLDRLDDARSALASAPPRATSGLARLRAVLGSRACDDPAASPRLLRVRCALALDLRERARALAAQGPDEPFEAELARAALTADVRDGLCRRARRRLDQLRAQRPDFDAADAERAVSGCREFTPREE